MTFKTNIPSIRVLRTVLAALFLLGMFSSGFSQESDEESDEDVTLRLTSKGWMEIGRIMQSSDKLKAIYNYEGNWLQSFGSQFTIEADVGENLQGAAGFGGFRTQSVAGALEKAELTSTGFQAYITEARLSYFVNTI